METAVLTQCGHIHYRIYTDLSSSLPSRLARIFPFKLVDGDKLYKGLTQIIAKHLDTLVERDIVPTFPRTGIMMDTSTSGLAGSSLTTRNASGTSSKAEIGTSGSGGSWELAVNESEAVEMALEGERFLRTIKLVWEDHIAIMKKMQLVLKYMVRFALFLCQSTSFANRYADFS